MVSSKVIIITFSLFSITCSSYAQENTPFTDEHQLNHMVYPIKLKDKTLFSYWKNNNTVITSIDADFKECEIPGELPANRWTLGNGKIVAMTLIVTHFTILDYKNCSSHSAIHIDDGGPYKYDYDKAIRLVVPYYDTFDVFDEYQKTCMPCRYNGKGERIQLNKTLVGDDDEYAPYDSYFVGPIKNSSDSVQGYFYGFTFKNKTTVLKLLDPNYNVVKQRTINGTIRGHAFQYGRATVCYCPDDYYLECQLFDSNWDTVATAKMEPGAIWDNIYVKIQNLEAGGAMVAMESIRYYIGQENKQEVYMQQIQPNGTVEPSINIGRFRVNYVSNHFFALNNGKYCLLTALEETKDDKGHSLVKCFIPKQPEKE